ncbi:MAG: UDP-3-O-(3-hydroxymyristoyl)glucosamine N-acyltransferase [Thermodesulfobacteriota bacterium]
MKVPLPSPSGVSLEDLARLVGGEVQGNCPDLLFGVSSLGQAGKGQITFLTSPKYLPDLETTRASAVIVGRPVPPSAKPLLITANPYLAYARIAQFFSPPSVHPSGISPLARVGADCRIGEGVSIYPFVYLGDGVEVEKGVVLLPGVYVGDSVRIGEDSIVYPNVSLLFGTVIGKRVIIHSGSVIGSDGFGFAQEGMNQVKIPQTGLVQIDDDCEIGANNTIDRASLGRTWLKKGVKTDNQVHVGHNVEVGEHTLLIAQVGISGSVTIGKGVILAGQVGVIDHLSIGDEARVTGKSGVIQSIPAKAVVSGYPAMPHKTFLRSSALFQRLPELAKRIQTLENRILGLEAQLKKEKEDHGNES